MTAPTVTGDTLAAIGRMLQSIAGPFVTVHVLNPVFHRLKVAAAVRWRNPDDGPASAGRLNAALIQYLSPWSSQANGGRWRTEADVDGFVRSFSDVDSVESIQMSYESDAAAEAEPTRYMLTSALEHDIRSVVKTAVAAAAGY